MGLAQGPSNRLSYSLRNGTLIVCPLPVTFIKGTLQVYRNLMSFHVLGEPKTSDCVILSSVKTVSKLEVL